MSFVNGQKLQQDLFGKIEQADAELNVPIRLSKDI